MAHPAVAEAAVIGVPHPQVAGASAGDASCSSRATSAHQGGAARVPRRRGWRSGGCPTTSCSSTRCRRPSVGKFSKKDLRARFADYQLPDLAAASSSSRGTEARCPPARASRAASAATAAASGQPARAGQLGPGQPRLVLGQRRTLGQRPVHQRAGRRRVATGDQGQRQLGRRPGREQREPAGRGVQRTPERLGRGRQVAAGAQRDPERPQRGRGPAAVPEPAGHGQRLPGAAGRLVRVAERGQRLGPVPERVRDALGVAERAGQLQRAGGADQAGLPGRRRTRARARRSRPA